MRKQHVIIISLLIIIIIVTGCSKTSQTFDDKNISFKVLDAQPDDELNTEIIEITNETGLDLNDLSLEISYSLDSNNNAEDNIFTILNGFNMKSNQVKEFSVPSIFDGNISAIDLEIDFKGEAVVGNEDIPFGIGGSLSALVER